MGATNISMSVKGDEKAVRKAYDSRVREDLHMYGHDPYNGSFSTFWDLSIKSIVLDGVNAAQDYLDEQQKGNCVAVRYKVFKPNTTMLNLQKKINQLDRLTWARDVTPRKQASAKKKLAEAKAKLNEWRAKKAAKVKRTMWLVGGWAAS